MDDFLIGGASAVMLIVLVLQLGKTYGLNSRMIPLLAAVLGVGFSVLAAFAGIYPDIQWWVEKVVLGLLVGLSAIGFHSATKFYQQEAQERALQDEAQEEQTITTATVTATPQGVSKEVEVVPIAPTLTAGGTPPQGGTL